MSAPESFGARPDRQPRNFFRQVTATRSASHAEMTGHLLEAAVMGPEGQPTVLGAGEEMRVDPSDALRAEPRSRDERHDTFVVHGVGRAAAPRAGRAPDPDPRGFRGRLRATANSGVARDFVRKRARPSARRPRVDPPRSRSRPTCRRGSSRSGRPPARQGPWRWDRSRTARRVVRDAARAISSRSPCSITAVLVGLFVALMALLRRSSSRSRVVLMHMMLP